MEIPKRIYEISEETYNWYRKLGLAEEIDEGIDCLEQHYLLFQMVRNPVIVGLVKYYFSVEIITAKTLNYKGFSQSNWSSKFVRRLL